MRLNLSREQKEALYALVDSEKEEKEQEQKEIEKLLLLYKLMQQPKEQKNGI